MVSVVQSGNWTRGSGSQGGTRTQPYGLRVQRRVFSTAGVKAHYLGDIVMTRETRARGGESPSLVRSRVTREQNRELARKLPPACINQPAV